jgi:hypothetical protein
MTSGSTSSSTGSIVWINGAFGSGKTTLTGELHRRRPDALVYDPEQIGYVLREIVNVPTGNFQDLPLWRSQAAALAVGLAEQYLRPVFVPMTLVRPQYVDEIFGILRRSGLVVHHFFLKVPPEELIRRIDDREVAGGDPEREAAARAWCKEQIASCVAALDTLPGDTVLLDGEQPTAALAEDVLARITPRG